MNSLRAPLLVPCVLWVLFTLPSLGPGQQDAPRNLDPNPEIERKTFKVAEGFEVSLWAADPLLAKPIQINFDSAGRLWVASSEAYPQIKPGQKQNDKILILEDTRGAGKADKVTVFADGLLIPTGLAPGDGGAYVADSSDVVFLSDPDGKGKATKKRVLLSGFGTEDTHHIIHTFRWGPECLLYFNQSVYIHSHIETPHGVRRLGGGGIWQFRPENRQLEVVAHGWWNPWGHEFTRWGQSIVTDGAGTEGINYLVPGAYYAAAPNAPRILAGMNPGSPKYCGQAIVNGRHLPDDWQGNIITNDFRAHRVCRFVLTEAGSGYTATEKAEVIKSDHPAFRPVDVKIGPDGAIYIADWYNPIIQHGEVDFRDPRRDQTHGRIWRVTCKNRPLVQPPPLERQSVGELLDNLKSPEEWTRLQSKLLLKRRGTETVIPELARWLTRLDEKDPEREHHLLEGLWLFEAFDIVEPNLLNRLLTAQDYHARAAAVRIVINWRSRLPDAYGLLKRAVRDEHPQVRLEAVRALAAIDKPEAVAVALEALNYPMDRYLDYALWLTVREMQPVWLPAFQKGELDLSKNIQHLTFALQATGSPAAIQPLVELLKADKIPEERLDTTLGLVARLGTPEDLASTLNLAGRESTPDSRKLAILEGLIESAHARKVRPAGDASKVGGLLASQSDRIRVAALRLAGLWHLESLRAKITNSATMPQASEEVRRAAFEALVQLGGAASQQTLIDLANGKSNSQHLRSLALATLASLDCQKAITMALDIVPGFSTEGDSAEVITAILQQKQGALLLTTTLADRKLPEDLAKVGVRVARASGMPVDRLIEALTKAGGISPAKRALTPEEMMSMVKEVGQRGNADRGEDIFRRADMTCLKCHAIGGAGGQVGPDLTSIGGSAQIDYLIDSLLDPNKAIKENYNTLIVTTQKGFVYTGIKVRESDTELVLRDNEGKDIRILTLDIDERKNGNSLMPYGLADPLTRQELTDLVRFLSELGKLGPYQLSKASLARRWQVLEANKEAKQKLSNEGLEAVLRPAAWQTWTPAYSTVGGVLPLKDIPRLGGDPADSNAVGFARCEIETSGPAKAIIHVNDAEGITAYFNGKSLQLNSDMSIDIPKAGTYTLKVAVDFAKRTKPLQLELLSGESNNGQVRFVTGK